ncbi:PEP/pyruvate-binding domain-containing protein [Lentzea sp. BCCO 10_0061]|uniref:PEP/pyruvate-binding domain-containing protein n=1 Tax=Lentzea sokolovensis TaxID=3095429 RepID=A0ABU4URH0_9PSEU|nr:PEP/pyruvate-binding domain-containing protein [Lentzea sp. BCCO 10_0061]MDX8142087.1 PEP/pyruvate-binding domain-containing protein [Lentzea sp. BCCO 10_0061]
MEWVRHLSAELAEPPEVLGGKAHGLVLLHRLGLPVPAGVVVTTEACRAFLRDGELPDGLSDELATSVETMGTPALVSVRSGSAVSMPGMMDTILNLRPTSEVLDEALKSVFSSWETPRARTYRTLHGIPHDLGTAVIVQRMVFGDRDDHSGSGVAFSRDPDTGEKVPFGEVLFGHQGSDVVSGRALTNPLHALADREPLVWHDLLAALYLLEQHYRDACYVEFTFEAGKLWLLQVRPGRFTGAAAVRLATDLVDERMIDRDAALLRVSPQHLRHVRTTRIASDANVIARGLGVCPGVASGRVAFTADEAVRMAADGPVVLVRPETSPDDIRGLAAATGIVTARGGPASHAAVVARSMGKPAVVGVADLVVGTDSVTVGGHTVGVGATVTIDGTSGAVVVGSARVVTAGADEHLHRLLRWADEVSGDWSEREEAERLGAAQAVLRQR